MQSLRLETPKVDMSRWRVPEMTVYVREAFDFAGLEIVVWARIRDVETGERGEVLNRKRVSHSVSPRELKAMIRAAVRDLVCHEVDECLFIDGGRLTDPHPEIVREAQAREMAGLK